MSNATKHGHAGANLWQNPSSQCGQSSHAKGVQRGVPPCAIETMHIIIFLLGHSISYDQQMARQYGCGPCRCHHSLGSPTKGTKSEVATSPLPSWGPKRGRKCYVTLAFSWVPNKGDKIRSGYRTPAFSGVTSKIWHIPNAQEALKTQLWNNKLVEKGQNLDLSVCRHTKLCIAGVLRAHCGQG